MAAVSTEAEDGGWLFCGCAQWQPAGGAATYAVEDPADAAYDAFEPFEADFRGEAEFRGAADTGSRRTAPRKQHQPPAPVAPPPFSPTLPSLLLSTILVGESRRRCVIPNARRPAAAKSQSQQSPPRGERTSNMRNVWCRRQK